MAIARRRIGDSAIDDGHRSGIHHPYDADQEEMRWEALLWLRELNESLGGGDARPGRVFATLSSSVQVQHQCLPPNAYLGKDDSAIWHCGECGMAWRFRLLAEGQSFGSSGGPYVWGEWFPERGSAQGSGDQESTTS